MCVNFSKNKQQNKQTNKTLSSCVIDTNDVVNSSESRPPPPPETWEEWSASRDEICVTSQSQADGVGLNAHTSILSGRSSYFRRGGYLGRRKTLTVFLFKAQKQGHRKHGSLSQWWRLCLQSAGFRLTNVSSCESSTERLHRWWWGETSGSVLLSVTPVDTSVSKETTSTNKIGTLWGEIRQQATWFLHTL